jgi:hypothetical protein
MTRRSLHHLFRLSALTLATVVALTSRAALNERSAADHDDDDRVENAGVVLPTGQYVTRTAIRESVQQYLNPNLPTYPNFIAGEAVRSQLSPDGTRLAVITAGQNSLYKADGSVDTPNRPNTSSSTTSKGRIAPIRR